MTILQSDNRPYVDLRLPDGRCLRAHPGAIIGRLSSAQVRIDHSQLSEVHALLSLRGGELWMIAMRMKIGHHTQNGIKRSHRLKLLPDMKIELIDDFIGSYIVEIIDIRLPDFVYQLRIERKDQLSINRDLGELLSNEYYSIIDADAPRLVSGWKPDGLWQFAINGTGWTVHVAGLDAQDLSAAFSSEVRGWRLSVQKKPVSHSGSSNTRVSFSIKQLEDGISVRVSGIERTKLTGNQGRLVGLLLDARRSEEEQQGDAFDPIKPIPLDKEVIKQRLWPEQADGSGEEYLKATNSLDQLVHRLHKKLTDCRIDRELIIVEDGSIALNPEAIYGS